MGSKSTDRLAEWIPPRIACKLLDVSQSALRQWADNGLVHVYRTPGGHRRFSSDSLRAVRDQSIKHQALPTKTEWNQAALRHIRHGLRNGNHSPLAWLEETDESFRIRLRLFGRRLLDLASHHDAWKRHRLQQLKEARVIGEEYGEAMLRLQIPLTQALETFAFFRNNLLEAARDTSTNHPRKEMQRRYTQANEVVDEVLLGIARSYDQVPIPPSTTYPPVRHGKK